MTCILDDFISALLHQNLGKVCINFCQMTVNLSFCLLVLLILALFTLKLCYQVDENWEFIHFFHRLIHLLSKYCTFFICSNVFCSKITKSSISIYQTSLLNARIVYFFPTFYFQTFCILIFKIWGFFKKHVVGLFLICAVNLCFLSGNI